ncbi:MAG: SgcJ/EcaC family oxidoreductase [Mycobacterium sp.]
MPNGNAAIRVAVIAGSRRPNRRSAAVAEWVCQAPAASGVELTLVDLDEVGLPLLAEPAPAASGEYTLEHTRGWSKLVDRFDAYVLVTPEYNHSTSAALKDALDHLYREWHDKAVAFVGYGTEGGVRAVEHLRGITAELGMAGVGPSVALNIFVDFDEAGALAVRERQRQMRERMLGSLVRWAGALRRLRADTAGEDVGAASGIGRPALGAGWDPFVGRSVAEQLGERLQRGLDSGDADLYDSMFAADVLWGSPYGQVLTGYERLNIAHRSMIDTPKLGHSRYEIVQTSMPAEGVVLAHVRRQSLSPAAADGPDLSEMALYVLIERDGQWWLAAGQNTPVRGKP